MKFKLLLNLLRNSTDSIANIFRSEEFVVDVYVTCMRHQWRVLFV